MGHQGSYKFRAQELNNALPDKLAKDVQCKREGIHGLFKSIIPDLQGINAWRYQRQISPGYQEYIEATSFQHYLETGKLLTMSDLASSLPADVPPASEEDHVLGLFDLTGEMMRFAITSTATYGKLPTSHHRLTSKHPGDVMEVDQVNDSARRTSLTDLQELRNYFEMLDLRGNKQLGKDYEQKVKVMKTSVEKVENVAYGIAVRKGERPAGWVPDMPAGPRVDVEAAA